MDDQKLDQFFEEKLKAYPNPVYQEKAWEQLVPHLPRPFPLPFKLLAAGLILLLLSSLFANFWQYRTQGLQARQLSELQGQVVTLQQQIQQVPHFQTTSTRNSAQRDTVYLTLDPITQPIYLTMQGKQGSFSPSSLPVHSSHPNTPLTPDTTTNRSPQANRTPKTQNPPSPVDSLSDSQTIVQHLPTPTTQADTNDRSIRDAGARQIPARSDQQTRYLKYWLQQRHLLLGLGAYGGPTITEFGASGNQLGVQLLGEVNLNHKWWLQTGIAFEQVSYEQEPVSGALPTEILSQLPGIVDPIQIDDLKEYTMRGLGLAIPISIRRQMSLNPDWEWAIQVSTVGHRFLNQRFGYELTDGTEPSKQFADRDAFSWRWSPLRLSVLALYQKRSFAPRVGLYLQGDPVTRGVEQMRHFGGGLEASFWIRNKN